MLGLKKKLNIILHLLFSGYDADSDSLNSDELEASCAISEQSDSQSIQLSTSDDHSKMREQNESAKENAPKKQPNSLPKQHQYSEDGESYNKFIDSLLQSYDKGDPNTGNSQQKDKTSSQSKSKEDLQRLKTSGGTNGGELHLKDSSSVNRDVPLSDAKTVMPVGGE